MFVRSHAVSIRCQRYTQFLGRKRISLFFTFIRIIVPIRSDVAVAITHTGCRVLLSGHKCVGPSEVQDREVRIECVSWCWRGECSSGALSVRNLGPRSACEGRSLIRDGPCKPDRTVKMPTPTSVTSNAFWTKYSALYFILKVTRCLMWKSTIPWILYVISAVDFAKPCFAEYRGDFCHVGGKLFYVAVKWIDRGR